MARNVDGPEITLYAAGNLSSYQFHIVYVDSSGYCALATDPDSPTTSIPVGVSPV